MAITFLEKRKKQQRLILAFAAVLLITLFVVWQGFLKKEKPVKVAPEMFQPEKKVEIDFSILQSKFLQDWRPFEKIEPKEEKIGRKNPFLPY